ncbi:tetratricopeptide repeat domain protein [Rhexocercosporidium sp. MPI-PUGE-AT-0058]|nr:tetratricopeptide repeat domain protein [Rhexocercosporidium sp. MPI-PUGE-AT-0058]
MCTKYGISYFNDESQNNNDRNSNWSLDIIAVHGLNGEKFRTWTESKSQKLWLRDFLPHDFSQARVMTFGYNATAAFENTKAGIRDHARALLLALEEARNGISARRRPLVLIGHSLGGLVLKQALVIAQHESRYKQIHSSVRGVMFFGTPHQGSGLASYATILAQVPLVIGIDTHPQLLSTLRKTSKELKRLTHTFREYMDASGIGVVSFYELRTLKGLMVVEKDSALITPLNKDPTNEEQIPVNDNHRGMCQFASPDDVTYKAALNSIKRLYESGGLADVASEHYVIPHTANPHFTGRTDIRRQLSDCLVFSRQEEVQQRFLLYGIGGSGKTQICLKFAQEYRKKFWGIFWIDASSTETAQEGFFRIARTCKLEESVDTIKSWLSTQQNWLLIFDNADDPDLDISKFFPRCAESTILITSRNPDLRRSANAGSCKVDIMSPEDAVTLLLTTSAHDRLDDKLRALAAQVAKELGYLALAIVQAGAVIRQGICSLDGFSELYSQHKRELLESSHSNSSFEYHSSVFTTWEISIRKIEGNAESHAKLALELLRLFSFLHFDGIDKAIFQLAREIAAEDEKAGYSISRERIFADSLLFNIMPSGWDGVLWGKAVGLLAAFSLITVENSHRISMHPLVHEWSRDRMSDVERTIVWDTAMVTVARSASHRLEYSDAQQRRRILPHIETLMANEEDRMFAPGPDLRERTLAAAKFMLAYTESRRVEKALNIGLKDLASKEGILDPTDLHCFTIRAHVAANTHHLGRWTEAALLQERLIADLAASDFSTHSPDEFTHMILTAIEGLASNYCSLGHHQKALDTCTAGIATYGLALDAQNLVILGLREVMVLANLGLGNVKESLESAEAILESRKKRLGGSHFMTLVAMENLARACEGVGAWKREWDLLERLLGLLRVSLGDEHPLTKEILWRLAILPARHKLPRSSPVRKKALVYREEVVQMMEKDFGERRLCTVRYKAEFAMELYNVGMFERAVVVQEGVVTCFERGVEGGEELGEAEKERERKYLEMMRKAVKVRKVVGWLVPRKGA